ncbi:hypothetical protein TGAM01_v210554 [Trichoderma gamsii]|uniref:Uncharacterized protein n=1 Tax=Trichoderma gamsii TaxID=398673 RepID=A0A2P4Z8J0_9HYPO|nr:hypothetical protein TGAM01_v210554 [Trichoderma gamsii]PON20596.1 hypothetical protein TGAM01_v210554 [Trichoderma gamsii]
MILCVVACLFLGNVFITSKYNDKDNRNQEQKVCRNIYLLNLYQQNKKLKEQI